MSTFPNIVPVAPLADQVAVPQSSPISICLTDDSGIDLTSLRVTVGAEIYVLAGVEQNGATLETEINDGNGFNIEITLPAPMPRGSRQEVTVLVSDDASNETELGYFFSVGVGPRLISVVNPMPGVLVASFNEAMSLDGAFLAAPSWRVEAITPGAPPIVVTDVFADPSGPNTAVLHHTGGGSTYELMVLGLVSQAGDPVEDGQNRAIFDLVFGAEDDPTIRLFDTIFGPIGISQRPRLRRTMDDHVINRSIALGMDEQFRLRFQTLDGTSGRDGRSGTRRT